MKTAQDNSKNKLTYLPGAARVVSTRKKRTGSLVLLAFLLYFAVLFMGQYIRLLQLRRTLDSIQADMQIVKAQNGEMQKEIERMNTPDYLEKLAREELGMVRSGELLFYLRHPDNLPVD